MPKCNLPLDPPHTTASALYATCYQLRPKSSLNFNENYCFYCQEVECNMHSFSFLLANARWTLPDYQSFWKGPLPSFKTFFSPLSFYTNWFFMGLSWTVYCLAPATDRRSWRQQTSSHLLLFFQSGGFLVPLLIEGSKTLELEQNQKFTCFSVHPGFHTHVRHSWY